MSESSEIPQRPVVRGPQDPRAGESWITDGVKDPSKREFLKAAGLVAGVGLLGKLFGWWDGLASALSKPVQPKPPVQFSKKLQPDQPPANIAAENKAESDAIRDAINGPTSQPHERP